MPVIISVRKSHNEIFPLAVSRLKGDDFASQKLAALPSIIESVCIADRITMQISLFIAISASGFLYMPYTKNQQNYNNNDQ